MMNRQLAGRWGVLFLALLLCLACQSSRAATGNRYPIVLVHGFTGWGPGEMGGIHYWGGGEDIAGFLSGLGHPTYIGVVGPVSSNWDRACELYAYIKGDRVDYGAAHSKRHGHARYGRTFPGLLPAWGETGESERIHLVGHSQGGQTIRVLAALLAQGDEAERAGTSPEDLHPLFLGDRNHMVHSITTLVSPHDGTTLATVLRDQAGSLLQWLLSLSSHMAAHYEEAPRFDFKLDQWDIRQHEGESDEAYRARLAKTHIWDQKDIATWDLRPVGALELNRRYPAVASIYYFSWGAQDAIPAPGGQAYLPSTSMNPLLVPASLAIGRYRSESPAAGVPALSEVWWPNDGVVNTLSMSGPKLGSRDRIAYAQSPYAFSPGTWYFMGNLAGWDHLDIIGHQTDKDFRAFYRELAELLSALPRHPLYGQ